jgi:hypothetical protein
MDANYTCVEARFSEAHRSVRLFLLSLLRRGRLSNLATREAGDTAAERRSISASRNALAINVILKAADGGRPRKLRELPAPHLRSHRRRSGKGSRGRVLTRGSLMRSPDNWNGRAVLRSSDIRRLQPPALAECRKINSGRRVPSRRAIACAKLHRDGLVAIRNPQ